MTLRAISYGGGVQSSALVVLATQGKLGPVDVALFANVGDDSEDPATLEYVRNVATPWAADRGLEVVELRRRYADGREYPTLREFLIDPARKGYPIPMYGSEAGRPGRRNCTWSWKVDPVQRWLKAHGATGDDLAEVMLGISVDELERAKSGGGGSMPTVQRITYPLLELGLNRADCQTLIADAGLPVPGKSACYFCPYHSKAAWSELRRDQPEQFELAAVMEHAHNLKRVDAGHTPVFLTKTGLPLDQAVTEAQGTLFDGPECESGYCWT